MWLPDERIILDLVLKLKILLAWLQNATLPLPGNGPGPRFLIRFKSIYNVRQRKSQDIKSKGIDNQVSIS